MAESTTWRNFIDGDWHDAADGRTDDVLAPATGQVIASVPSSSQVDVDRAVAAAAKAFETWGLSTPSDRSAALLELAARCEEHAEELAQVESENAGKPIAAAREELPFGVDNLRFFAAGARNLDTRAAGEYVEGYTSFLRRDPLGVVGQIAPWNYPWMMAIWKIGPALAAGNTVVLKPSELTPLSTLKMMEIAADVFPPGVVNVICGQGETTGAPLVGHPDVRMVSLTGEWTTGVAVARNAAENLTRVHLELGGKAPVIVFDDADLDAVIEGVKVGGYVNAGQDCTAGCRVIAGPKLYDDLVAGLADAAASLVTGDLADEATELGPVISAEQQARVAGFVDRAREAGAEVVAGGSAPDRPGFWYDASVVANPAQDSEIVQREVFGPVVTVQRFSDDEEAIRWANDVEFGLASSVWTQNPGRAMKVSSRIQFGTVWINDHIPICSEMPHGGFKKSGYGKDMSIYSIEDYTEIKHVMIKH